MNFMDILHPACAVFLDFDGTLVDLAAEPGAVVVPDTLVHSLSSLNSYLSGAIAVISGRPIGQIDAFLHPLRLPAAGVHGAERRTFAGEEILMSTYPLEQIEQAAQALAARHEGLLVENKRGSVALHYRQAPELESMCLEVMRSAVDQSPGLTLLKGKMVVEAKPGGASKGRAIELFLAEAPFTGRVPVFVGDDITDEVGFATVQRLGGLGIKVGEGPTVAWERMPSPAHMRDELAAAVNARVSGATT